MLFVSIGTTRYAPFQKPRSERGTISITMLLFRGPVEPKKPANRALSVGARHVTTHSKKTMT